MYIFVDRTGGLGNQLFKYAAARAVSRLHPGSKIVLDDEKDNAHNLHQHNYADIFMRDALQLSSLGEGEVHIDRYYLFEQGGAFVPWDPTQISLPVKMCGYFQYLPSITPVLFDVLSDFRDGLKPYRDRVASMGIKPERTVFMHIRRGDYLKHPDFHYIQGLAYYKKAVDEWRRDCYKNDDFVLYIISDDPVWCREQTWGFPYVVYENDNELETLALMSMCKAGAIIGNSSFSYWGAMISQTPYVFYPERWIGEKIHSLFPSYWKCVTTS